MNIKSYNHYSAPKFSLTLPETSGVLSRPE